MKFWIFLFAFLFLLGGASWANTSWSNYSTDGKTQTTIQLKNDHLTVVNTGVFKNPTTYQFVLGMFLGFVLILLIYSFLIYVNVKQPVFLWFFIYTFVVSAYLLTAEGILFKNDPEWVRYFTIINSGFVFYAFKSFFQLVLDTKELFPIQHKIMNMGFVIGALFLILQLFMPNSLGLIVIARMSLVAVAIVVFYCLVMDVTLSVIQSSFLKVSIMALLLSGMAFTFDRFLPNYKSTFVIYGFSFMVIHIISYSVSILFRIKILSDKKESLWQEIRQSKNDLLLAYIAGAEEEKKRITNDLQKSVISEVNQITSFQAISNEGFNVVLEEIKRDIELISNEYSFQKKDKGSGLIKKIQNLANDHTSKETQFVFKHFNYTRPLDQSHEKNLYRIIQEAVQNAEKYAQAKFVEIQIYQSGPKFMLIIEDDGIGFDVKKKQQGIGLKNMKKRVSEMHGSYNIASSSGKGVSILIVIEETDV
ncbi:MAG: sensor histidine kinase [Salibacteraceae bacterium]